MASSVELREVREWSEGANGQQGKAPEGARGFNGLAWSRCRVHLEGEDWAMQAVLLVRRRELGLGLGSAKTGEQCLLRGSVGFRSGVSVSVLGTARWAG
jgi:hypothetical protein